MPKLCVPRCSPEQETARAQITRLIEDVTALLLHIQVRRGPIVRWRCKKSPRASLTPIAV